MLIFCPSWHYNIHCRAFVLNSVAAGPKSVRDFEEPNHFREYLINAEKKWAIDSFECLYHVYRSGSAHVFTLQAMKYERWWEMLRSSIWNEAKSRRWWNSAEVWGWGGHNGCTKEGRGSGHDVHAAICLKEGGSISNFRSKEGQLKHGEGYHIL